MSIVSSRLERVHARDQIDVAEGGQTGRERMERAPCGVAIGFVGSSPPAVGSARTPFTTSPGAKCPT